MSASLFYLSCRSQEVGESNASCLWSLHLLKRQKSKLQGNLKTTQNRHNPPPLQHSLFEKQSANNKWGNDYEKEEFITQETQTWVMTFTCIQVVTCIPSRVKVFQILSEENSFLPPRKEASLVILQLQLIHRMWWSQPSVVALKTLPSSKVLFSVYNTPVLCPPPPSGLPLPPGSFWSQPPLNPFISHQSLPILAWLSSKRCFYQLLAPWDSFSAHHQ